MDAVQQPMVAIQPGQQESEEDFIVRAHHALADQIPDPSERNQAVWNSWDRVKGNQLLEQAHSYFAGDQYTATSPRPFFMEHEKVNYDGDGQEQITNYDLNELTRIVRENNHRIQDTDAYTALVDKHTLPPPYRDPDPPKNLGFVGPYRLGMMGRKIPVGEFLPMSGNAMTGGNSSRTGQTEAWKCSNSKLMDADILILLLRSPRHRDYRCRRPHNTLLQRKTTTL